MQQSRLESYVEFNDEAAGRSDGERNWTWNCHNIVQHMEIEQPLSTNLKPYSTCSYNAVLQARSCDNLRMEGSQAFL